MGKVVMVVVVAVAVMFALVSILNIGLYAGAMDLDYNYNEPCKGPCRERTGAVGIVASALGFLLSLAAIAAFVLPLFVPALAAPMPSLVLRLVVLACLFVVLLFYITAWALMAKDIDDFNSASSGYCDNPPDVWSAALSFGLIGLLLGIALFAAVTVALVVNRGGNESSPSSNNPAKSDY